MRRVVASVLMVGWFPSPVGRTGENTKPDTIAVANAIIPKLR